MKKLVNLIGIAALSIATVCSSAFSAEIQTAAGSQEIAEKPNRIAVFDIAAIDTLDALGVKIDGVPNNLYIDALKQKLGSTEQVGTLFEPDLEALNALAPELIIVGGRSSTQIEQTSRVAPSIDMTIWGDDLIDQARQRILDYGKLFEIEEKTQSLVSEFDAKIEETKSAANGKGNALIVMTNGPKISVYGPNSRFGWVHTTLDIPAADPQIDAGEHGDAVSFEFIAEIDPDWLIVVDRAAAIGSNEQNAKATLDNELIRNTKAWQSGQVIYVPSSNVYIAAGGARSTMAVFDALAEGFSKAE
jgi:iron complex transport system substrate-binding protein